MEGQGRNHYFDELLNSSSLPDYSMASEYGHLNGYYAAAATAAANQRMSDPGYIAALTAAANQRGFFNPQSDISTYQPLNNYDTTSLESEFNRLGISQPQNNRRMRAPSVPSNLNLLYMDPNLYTGNLNLNLNGGVGGGLSSYAYNYGRPAAAAALVNSNADYNRLLSRVSVEGHRSDFEVGQWNNSSYPIVKSRPPTTNGLVGSQSAASLRRPMYLSLKELRGSIALAAKDQNGCRFLQNKLDEGNPEDIDLIFSEVKDNICELMVDQFGAFLVQKSFIVCDEEQRTQLLCLLLNDERKFKDICTDTNGTRAVQKLLEYVTTQEQRSLVVGVLRRMTFPLIKNSHGQHVIQQCLKNFSSEDTKHILNVVVDNCIEIAKDKSGCCVLQQCLTDSVGESRNRLIEKITSNAYQLSEHPYGNYVVQFILGLRMGQAYMDILEQLRGSLVSLSMNKYGSNVVEKLLKHAEGDEAVPVINELIHSPDILKVLLDPFGNYVAQSALLYSRGRAYQDFSRLVNDKYQFLHSHPHGKRVLARTKGYKLRP